MGFLIPRLRKPSTSTFRDARVGPQFYVGLNTASYWGRNTSGPKSPRLRCIACIRSIVPMRSPVAGLPTIWRTGVGQFDPCSPHAPAQDHRARSAEAAAPLGFRSALSESVDVPAGRRKELGGQRKILLDQVIVNDVHSKLPECEIIIMMDECGRSTMNGTTSWCSCRVPPAPGPDDQGCP